MIHKIIELELKKILQQYQLQDVDLQLNPTESESHGDYATNIALSISRVPHPQGGGECQNTVGNWLVVE